ncbi:hypothetical protein CSHOW_0836 [Campylobacter showae]|uniref:Uncharacterized protein n=1 Tax=Campylobacter showae RM3277 TaxID=553219 RepID=C6RFM8_9BACT|nr:hypothetical protein CAMSH0001_0534 [Campylobacter showae RM3277]QCD48778.1 hypothetical protein CSHOW_0836 [Campylobacter showae]
MLTIAGASTLIFSQNFILKYFRQNIFKFPKICKFGTPFAKYPINARNRAEFVNFRLLPGIKQSATVLCKSVKFKTANLEYFLQIKQIKDKALKAKVMTKRKRFAD